jgi:ribose 5-phosphate isomerase B
MIYLGSDHAGWKLKQEVKKILDGLSAAYKDLGNAMEDPNDDYPDYAFAVGEAVAKEPGSFGVLVCGSAQGVCIAANKVPTVKAVYVASPEEAMKTREHNDANVLCLSGWKQTAEEAKLILTMFLDTQFNNEERHARRLEKINEYEKRA